MAKSIIEQLQEDALAKDVSVSDLLRKAKVVAARLGLTVEWIDHELNGYPPGDEVPTYRKLHGRPQARDPYHGWTPIVFTNDDEAQVLISSRPAAQSIAEIEGLAHGEGELMTPFAPAQVRIIAKAFNMEPTEMGLVMSRSQMKAIANAVRNRVLDWSLSLGNGPSFKVEEPTPKEPNVVYNITTTIEGNYAGSIGHLDHSEVRATQTVVYGVADLRKIVDQIKVHAEALGLPPDRRQALDAEVATIEGELSKPKPDRSVLRRSFDAVKRLGGAVTGNLIAEGIVASIDKIPWDSLNLPF